MYNSAQMKESKCAKDILKCANEKRRNKAGVLMGLLFIEAPRGVCGPMIPENNALISPTKSLKEIS